MALINLPNINDYADPAQLVPHGKNSKLGLSVPEVIFEYGHGLKGLSQRIPVLSDMVRSLKENKLSYTSLKDNPQQASVTILPRHLAEVERMALEYGCHSLGFTQVDPSMIFVNKGILFPNAIVLTMEMAQDKVATAPSKACVKEIFRTYKEMGIIVNRISAYLRHHGYAAQAGPALGGDVNYPLLAQKAGLGHCGRHGLLISPEIGPRQRIAAVYTNIENLPYTDTQDHNWIESFCSKCRRCQKACPGKAIYQDVHHLEDGTKQHIDYTKCAVPFSTNYGCTVCIKECTFNVQTYDTIKSGFMKTQNG